MSQPSEHEEPEHTDVIRHADLDAAVRVLNELIFECQRRLEAIGHAELGLGAHANAGAQGCGREPNGSTKKMVF